MAFLTSAVACTTLAPLAAVAQVDFRGFGILPGASYSIANGVSADGTTAVGVMYLPSEPPAEAESWAIRWTFSGGAERLVPPAPYVNPSATAVSRDGSVIVGNVSSPMPPGHAFYWTRDTGFSMQHALQSNVISDDGRYDFGQSLVVGSPYRRVLGSTEYELLGLSGRVVGASGDGSIAVGSQAPSFSSTGGAWRWTEASGQVGLGALPDGANRSDPLDVTPDGAVIVGKLERDDSSLPFRWTESGGYELLATLSSAAGAIATNVAADGRTIVGYSTFEDDSLRAAIWLPDGAVHDLSEYLGSLGAELDGWTLSYTTGISDDGLTIVGNGINPDGVMEGWVVRIPSPGAGALLLLAAFTRRRRE